MRDIGYQHRATVGPSIQMTTRQNRVSELLRSEISDIILRELKDPRRGFITITGVEVTSDMRLARVFVSILGTEKERAGNLAMLNRAKYFIRQSVGKRISIKTLPEIEFELDTSVDEAIHMLELLEQIKHDEQDSSP
jgi:ribosome-binding factor A